MEVQIRAAREQRCCDDYPNCPAGWAQQETSPVSRPPELEEQEFDDDFQPGDS